MKYIFIIFSVIEPAEWLRVRGHLFISAAVRGAEAKPPNLTRTRAELGRKVRAECIETQSGL